MSHNSFQGSWTSTRVGFGYLGCDDFTDPLNLFLQAVTGGQSKNHRVFKGSCPQAELQGAAGLLSWAR